MLEWRRRSACLWMAARLVTLLCILGAVRRMARLVDEHTSRAIEEAGSAVAPLLLFALLWLIADPLARPDTRHSANSSSG